MPPISDEEPGLGQDGTLNRADCLCPICLEIFLEPVTLPCTHTFCKPCFLETVDKANICCPLCRKRVSNWARLNSRNKTLVNTELWRRIQDAFPTQCQRRLNGVGEEEEDVNMFMQKPRVSQPGELRREYEEEINKFVEEKRALEEAERKASEEYIQRLLAEEQERVEEERRRQEERQLEDDERLARLLSEELNASPILETQRNNKVNESSKKKKSNVGHIEKYLTPYTQSHCETKQSSTRLDNKENILNTSASSIELHSLDSSNKPSTSSSGPETCNQLFDTSNITNSYAKRKSADGEQAVTCKKPCTSPSPSSPLHDCAFLQEMAEQEEGFRIRLQQEEEDRRLALRLQRELNREYNVDRRKGSADSYLLREKNSPSFSSSSSPGEENKTGRACSPHSSRQKVDGHKAGKRANNQVEGRSLKTSSSSTPVSPSTSSSVQKGRKQTTLTEMFPSPGN